MAPVVGASPFPRPRISPREHQDLEDLADQMLDRTLRSYDQFLLDRQQVDKKRWKEIRSEGNASIYVKRGSSGEDSLSGANVAWRGLKDPMVIVGLGRCDGTVDDMLSALAGGNSQQSLASTAYLNRSVAGLAVVATLKQPTVEDPHRVAAIEWIAYPAPPVLDLLVKTRDYVYLKAKGVTRRSNGDLIGYHLMQSVDLPDCPPLDVKRTYIRGRVMLGSIFIQRPDNSVDVFFETFIESNGRLSNKIAQYYSSMALTSYFHLDESGKRIKLHWCINMARRSYLRRGRNAHQISGRGSCFWDCVNDCLMCRGIPGSSSGLDARCALCYHPICSNCEQTVMIKHVSDDYDVTDEKVSICESCLTRADSINAAEVARQLVNWHDLYGSSSELGSETSSSGRTPNT